MYIYNVSAAHECARGTIMTREEKFAIIGWRPHAEIARIESDVSPADGLAGQGAVH